MFRNLLLYILAIIFFSCEEPPEFPTDGSGTSDIDPPITTILTASGTTFDSSTVTIQWEGNESARIFDYRLEYEDTSIPHSWMEWDTTSTTSVEFSDLDEGLYTFFISGRYNVDNVENIKTFSFTVNAISGPALRIYPLRQEVTANSNFDIHIYLEEIEPIENIIFLKIYIDYDPTILTYTGFEKSAVASDLSLFPTPADENSQILIEGGRLGSDISGTGPVGKLTFNIAGQAESTQINIGEATFYMLGSSNDTLVFSNTVGGLITVTP